MGAQDETRIAPASTSVDAPTVEPPLENRTFDEIEIGESASLERTLSWRDVELFAVMSGDINPAHIDEKYARSDRFHGIVAHGMWGASLISTLLGTRLPGPGTIYLEQTLCFRHPITIGDAIGVSVTVASKDQAGHRVVVDCRCVNQRGETVIDGTAKDGEGSAAAVRAPRGVVARARRGFDVGARLPPATA